MKLTFPISNSDHPWIFISSCDHRHVWKPSKRYVKFWDYGGWLPLNMRTKRPFHFKNKITKEI
ncbi:MAG: hypothetical protein GY870_05750 [archaeon]|nr:hypothetical protein [archaeon]